METNHPTTSPAAYAPIALPGMGIAAGLDIRRDGNQNIVLSQGYGYTSAGHLVQVPEPTTFYFYAPVDEQAVLDYFQCGAAWELFETINPDSDMATLHPRRPEQQREAPFLDDKVMAVWQGGESAPRYFLLQRQAVAGRIFSRPLDFQLLKAQAAADQGFDLWAQKTDAPPQQDPSTAVSDYAITNALHPVYALPLLAMRHVGYGHLDTNDMRCDEVYGTVFCDPMGITHFETLRDAYCQVIDPALGALDAAIHHLHHVAHGWLPEHQTDYLVRHFHNLCARWAAYQQLRPLAATTGDQSGIQYWYACIRDLVDAYNETREAALAYQNLVPGAQYPFPNHLYLGTPQEEQTFSYPNPFRTHFRYPVMLNGQMEQLERLRFLHWRMTIMMKSFYVPGLEWDDTASDSYLSVFRDINGDNPDGIEAKINMPIRITPSRGYDEPLGHRAIPYYFDVADHPQSLHWYWDYDATRHNRADRHFSYHAENDSADIKTERGEYFAGTDKSSYTRQPEVIHPFLFDQRSYPFLRVEGLVGKVGIWNDVDADFTLSPIPVTGDIATVNSIKTLLEGLQKQYNICFEVEFVNLGATATDKFKFCGRCIDHLGGTYRGGILVVLLAAMPSSSEYKIVGDFYSAHGCTCVGKETRTEGNTAGADKSRAVPTASKAKKGK